MSGFNLSEWALKHEEATDKGVHARLADLIRQRDSVRVQIAEALPGVRAKALQQIDDIIRVAEMSVGSG